MIGVHAEAADHNVVCEFFELFKTPWEFARQDRHYEVLLHSGDGRPEATGKLVLVYAGRKVSFDQEQEVRSGRDSSRLAILSYLESRFQFTGSRSPFRRKAVSSSPGKTPRSAQPTSLNRKARLRRVSAMTCSPRFARC